MTQTSIKWVEIISKYGNLNTFKVSEYSINKNTYIKNKFQVWNFGRLKIDNSDYDKHLQNKEKKTGWI